MCLSQMSCWCIMVSCKPYDSKWEFQANKQMCPVCHLSTQKDELLLHPKAEWYCSLRWLQGNVSTWACSTKTPKWGMHSKFEPIKSSMPGSSKRFWTLIDEEELWSQTQLPSATMRMLPTNEIKVGIIYKRRSFQHMSRRRLDVMNGSIRTNKHCGHGVVVYGFGILGLETIHIAAAKGQVILSIVLATRSIHVTCFLQQVRKGHSVNLPKWDSCITIMVPVSASSRYSMIYLIIFSAKTLQLSAILFW